MTFDIIVHLTSLSFVLKKKCEWFLYFILIKTANSSFINYQFKLINYPNVFECGLFFFFKYITRIEGDALNTFYVLMIRFSFRLLRIISEETI